MASSATDPALAAAIAASLHDLDEQAAASYEPVVGLIETVFQPELATETILLTSRGRLQKTAITSGKLASPTTFYVSKQLYVELHLLCAVFTWV